jgi:hypothetical protein
MLDRLLQSFLESAETRQIRVSPRTDSWQSLCAMQSLAAPCPRNLVLGRTSVPLSAPVVAGFRPVRHQPHQSHLKKELT